MSEAPPRRVPAPRVPAAVPVTAGLLTAFFLLSRLGGTGRNGFGATRPIYALSQNDFHPAGLAAIAVGAVCVGFAVRLGRRGGGLRWREVTALALLSLGFAAALVGIDGSPAPFTDPIERQRPPDYHADVGFVEDLGVRGFVQRYDEVIGDANSIHSQTHPPGAILVIAGLERAFPAAVVPRALVFAMLSASLVIPTWLIARRVAGERAATAAALFIAVAPAVVLHTFLSLDGVIATLMAWTLLALVRGLGRDGTPRAAAIAGGAVGAVAFVTYAASFLAMFGVIYAVWTRPVRDAARALAWAAAGGVAALIVLRVVIGFDLFAAYAGSRIALEATPNTRSALYWLLGNPAAWLAFAGMPIAAFGLTEVIRRRPPFVLALLVPLTIFYALPWSVTRIIPGETERTLIFALPLAAAAAGAAFVRWEERRGAAAPGLLSGLVGVAAAQAVLFEALYLMLW